MRLDLKTKTHRTVIAGILAAVILALTLISFPIPNMAGAYINLGDAGVYIAAFLLGNPWGALCAAVGSALGDLVLGSVIYAWPTFIIKAAMALVAALLIKKMNGKIFLPLILAGLIMPLGYYLFEGIVYGHGAAIAGVALNLLQYAVGVTIGGYAVRFLKKILAKNK
ncbi:MAG: ECF transporter S component [Clostridiales bacterium]|jgi:uncharacterized membrane protein|nr:ECF transporter S component [Clostridiales bacterium]